MPEKPLYGVTEDDEDQYFLLDLFRLAALVFEFGKRRLFDTRIPAGRRIGEINSSCGDRISNWASAFSLIPETLGPGSLPSRRLVPALRRSGRRSRQFR